MSVRSDAAVCKYCGLVDLALKMVRLEGEEYVYACQGCAVAQRGADASMNDPKDASSAVETRRRSH